ncbi:MAG: hypothetical protein WDW36_004134 [Sanguina aurantia]
MGAVVILQHPHELKKRLATVPLLARCLDGCHVVVGRKFTMNHTHPVQDAAAPEAQQLLDLGRSGQVPMFILFPGKGAQHLPSVTSSADHQRRMQAAGKAAASHAVGAPMAAQGASEAAAVTASPHALARGLSEAPPLPAAQAPTQPRVTPPQPPPPAYILFVVDGTWRQAKEMFTVAAGQFLPPQGPAVQVMLPVDAPQPHTQAHAHTPTTAASHPAASHPAASTHTRRAAATTRTLPTSPPDSSTAASTPAGSSAAPTASTAATGAEDLGAGCGHASPSDQDSNQAGWGTGLEPSDGVAGGAMESLPALTPSSLCLLRKEPTEYSMTTHEAVARALGLLEGNAELAAMLIAPLRLMTMHQASFDPAVQARMAGQKEDKQAWASRKRPATAPLPTNYVSQPMSMPPMMAAQHPVTTTLQTPAPESAPVPVKPKELKRKPEPEPVKRRGPPMNLAQLENAILWEVWQPWEDATYTDAPTDSQLEISDEQLDTVIITAKRSVLNVPVHCQELAHRSIHFNEPVTLQAMMEAVGDFYKEPLTLDDLEEIPDDKEGGYLAAARRKLLAKQHVTWLDLIGQAGTGPVQLAPSHQTHQHSNGRVRFHGVSSAVTQGSSRRESARASTAKYVLKLSMS